jgi:hypothetical protein
MVNVKLGDKTYTGVTAVKTDTPDGGTAEFAPYDETFAAGKAEGLEEGYTSGKTDGISEGYTNCKAEISVDLDSLISETDAEWIETLASYSVEEKIQFMQSCLGDILGAISAKGVSPQSPQPLRTISELVSKILAVSDTGQYWGEYTKL